MADLLSMFNELDESQRKRSAYIKAPFAYVGGKSKSLDKILPHLPNRATYVEPFGGSGAVLLARQPSNVEVFNDRYSGLVDFFRCLKTAPKKLEERLSMLLHSREEFYWCRETWKDPSDRVERAARWYYMLQHSFIHKGVVFARATRGGVSPKFGSRFANRVAQFGELHKRLINVQIENLDWKDCIADYDHRTAVFYLDPPYLLAHSGSYKHDMSLSDHQDLIGHIQGMTSYVALSGYDNALYDSVDWDHKYQWEATVTADAKCEAGTANNRGQGTVSKALETLWIREAR